MNYYENDTSEIWKKKLITEWYNIRNRLEDNHKISLPIPAFEIVEEKWGRYVHASDGTRTICLSRHLFSNFGWGAVVHVLSHETAHYIVDYVWKMSDLESHGEAFSKACKLLSVDDRRCSSTKDLLDSDSDIIRKESIVGKIKKVMALSSSSEKGEAENALRKAEELMLKYNIESLDNRKMDEYLFRPIGPIMRKMPNYMRDLANLVHEFYFVNHILCYYGRGRYFEFFGTKENLDLAEYIFCSLLYQSERLWEEHSRKLRKECGGVRGLASKACFIEGLIHGYYRKLQEQRDERRYKEKTMPQNCALIWKGDPLMDEMYRKTYPNLRHYNISRNASGGGWHSGFEKGHNLSLNTALTTSSSVGNGGKMLRA